MYLCSFVILIEFYNDSFFESLDGVCNALDNVDASEFVQLMSSS